MFGLDDAMTGLIGSVATGLFNNSAASARQDDAQGFSAEQYANRYQTTVADMKAAGLNPMLAYGQGAGSAPGGVISNATPMPDIGSSVNASKLASAQVANVQADTKNKEASADLIAGQAAQAWASASQSNANVGLIQANVNKVIEETKNIPVEGDRLRYAIQLLAEQAAKTAQEGETQVSVRKQIEATIAKLGAETKLFNFDIKAAQDMGNFGREAGQLKPFIEMVLGVLRSRR